MIMAPATGMRRGSGLGCRTATVVGFAFSSATTAGGLDRRGLGQKFFPAMLAAKVKRLAAALGAEPGRFVHRHSANRVFGHGCAVAFILWI
jgi:hypothetical protein